MWCAVTVGEARHDCFRKVMLVERQLNSSVMRWPTQEVAVCVAGVGQCASLKVRKCVNPCFHNISERTGLRKLVV